MHRRTAAPASTHRRELFLGERIDTSGPDCFTAAGQRNGVRCHAHNRTATVHLRTGQLLGHRWRRLLRRPSTRARTRSRPGTGTSAGASGRPRDVPAAPGCAVPVGLAFVVPDVVREHCAQPRSSHRRM